MNIQTSSRQVSDRIRFAAGRRAVIGVVVLAMLTASVGAAGPVIATPAPAAWACEDGNAVMAALEPLAEHNVGLVRIFAKRMADSMAKYGLTPSAKLSAIKLEPGQSALGDAQLAKIQQAAMKTIGATSPADVTVDWYYDAPSPVSPPSRGGAKQADSATLAGAALAVCSAKNPRK